jgi:hypothetical protein
MRTVVSNPSNGFKVCARKCDRCLFSRRPLLSPARRRELLATCRSQDRHFVCHEHGVEGHGADVCCRGFYDANPGATNLMRIAARLGAVVFVEPPEARP